jgi:quinol monooxygenase YgiN
VTRQDDGSQDRRGAVRLSGLLRCASDAEAELVRRHLPEHVRLTRAEPGCLAFEVTPTDDPLTWRVEERFTDRAAFDAHQRRTRASAWGAATAAIRRDYQLAGS